ncbi:hypothetical protein KC851_01225 [Candidatus Kaiserbacteria bacterium]|nr:hypothetical protein [Candidatus Kaiserbacteria bacterium]
MEIREVKGLLRAEYAPVEVLALLCSDLPEAYDLHMSKSLHCTKDGFQIAARELFVKDKYTSPKNRISRLFQVGQIVMEGNSARFSTFFSFDMEEDYLFRDFKIENRVSFHEPTGSTLYNIKLWSDNSQFIPLKIVFAKAGKGLTYNGLRLIKSDLQQKPPL